MTSKTPMVVFDFDLTLTTWDTSARFFRWLILRQVWRLATVALALPVLALLFVAKSTRQWAILFAVWVATFGLTRGQFNALARYHAKRVFAQAQPVFLRDGLRRIEHHVNNGDSVIVATGCLEILATQLLLRAGFGHITVVGSTLRPLLGGMTRDQHCFGQSKVRMLTERGFAPPWTIGYTDSSCDLPVLRHCRERHLVNGKAGCMRIIESSLATKVNVLAWR